MNNNKEGFKLILLGCLIIGAIIQTGNLWLGSVSSHTFLKQATTYEPIMPINIWLVETSNNNTGVSNAMAYRLEDTIGNEKREYERLTDELSRMISQYSSNEKLAKIEGVDWTRLLSMPSIIYEYEVPIDIEAITGEKGHTSVKDTIDHVILYSKNKFQKEATLFLVNSQEDFMYEFSVTGTFKDIGKIYNTISSNELKEHIMAYQPSATVDKMQVKGNIFLPTSSKETLVSYDVLTSYNPIDLSTDEGYTLLENAINGLFESPLVKEKQEHEDGSVVYTENMKSLVMYRPVGVVEYLNLSPAQTQNRISVLDGYNTVLEFMEKIDTIPESIRSHLYVSRIDQKDNEMTFYFEMTYDGYRVQLSESIRADLGIDALVEVTVKGNDIISATISTLEIEPKSMHRKDLETHYLEPIDKMYSLLQEQNIEDFTIDNLELVYLLDDLETDIDMTWGAIYDNRWYYP